MTRVCAWLKTSLWRVCCVMFFHPGPIRPPSPKGPSKSHATRPISRGQYGKLPVGARECHSKPATDVSAFRSDDIRRTPGVQPEQTDHLGIHFAEVFIDPLPAELGSVELKEFLAAFGQVEDASWPAPALLGICLKHFPG